MANRSSTFVDKVKAFVDRHNLLDCKRKYLVALSGGADSVSLMLVMIKLGYKINAVHCNFHLRGEEADRDELFCRSLCEHLDVPLSVAHFATRNYASAHKISIEMAARYLRYDYFERLRCDIGADAVAVAHHKDDTVETLLINLIRGTGIHGLTGIACRRDNIVRPLLCVSRQEILAFLKESGQDFVDDSTNMVDDVVRNKIRLNIVPLMKEINPSLTDAVATTAERVRMAADIFDVAMEDRIKQAMVSDSNGCHIYELDKIHDEYTFYCLMKPFGFSASAIEDAFQMVKKPKTGALFSSQSHEMTFHRGKLVVMKKGKSFKTMKLPECGRYVIGEDGRVFVLKRQLAGEGFKPSKMPHSVSFDADKVSFPLILRTVKEGDRFYPFGMKGSKLVSDLLTDMKTNILEKQRQLVLADEYGKILWVVGKRTDNRFRVDETSKEIITAEFSL